MADLMDLENAKAVFQTLCQMLDKDDWHYKKDEEKLYVNCGARGEDLPMELDIHVDAERMMVILLSHMPFDIQEDRRLEVAIGITAINDHLVHGCFDFNVNNGNLLFRMANSFMDSKMGEDAMHYLVYCACQTIDEYNDKLMMLAKGILPIEQFLKVVG